MNQAVTTEDSALRPEESLETDKAALRAIAQAAVNVELFTIPLYMTAMYSIQGMHQITGQNEDFYQGRLWPGLSTTAAPATANEKAFNIIFSVFVEEMLHLQMAANIASCAGVAPKFTMLQTKNNGWTCYGQEKTVIPHIVDLRDTVHWDNVKVDIGAVTAQQLRLFDAIEQPEADARKNIKQEAQKKYFPTVPFVGWTPGKDLPMFGTIGWMYRCYMEYMKLRYTINDVETTLWEHVCDPGAVQRDLFNYVKDPGHPKREYERFETTVSDNSLKQVWEMMSAITDQGEGSELPPLTRTVMPKYQASEAALKDDYPSFTDTGRPADSADAAARFRNGGRDHYERFDDLRKLLDDVRIWPDWRAGEPKPWKAEDLVTAPLPHNKYGLPAPEAIAEAMNELGAQTSMYGTVSQAARGSIAGVTTVLDDYWSGKTKTFPYPSMAGSGDRMAICWALFRRAPDLAGDPGTTSESTLGHSCQGLDLTIGETGTSNDCAAVDTFHSCRGSNACKAEGGCGFVQKTSGGGICGHGLVKAKIVARDDGPFSAPGDNRCATYGGCAVPISASQVLPRSGTMEVFDFVGEHNEPQCIGTMQFTCGEKVYDAAYRAYQKVMEHRGKTPPPRPEPNPLRLAFPPST
ncbi:ferritin-like domain-containing protein [Actinophytocola oryzae]|uniref:Ferritin-like protein n=1 Tax=Actinophytocola oryzae TaxID=502181 RepID=A0A4R7W1K5_9PSEU|nr:ferritin-like domain-containing protein [Actinophytocola oryzae]TDV56354.1 ferritin-like protein [Actinophytocola oryzae]